jgi:hypothetical protein
MVERQRHGFNFERWVRQEFCGESYGAECEEPNLVDQKVIF